MQDYVNGTVMHLPRLDARTGLVVTTMNTEVGRSWQRQTLFTTLYGRCLRRAVAGILDVTWELVKNVHVAKFQSNGMKDKERRAVRVSSELVPTVTFWIPFEKRLY